MYLSMRVKSLMSLKVRSILGPPKKISKSPKVERFSEIMLKVNLPMGIRPFSYKFPKICSKSRISRLESAVKSSKLRSVHKR